MLAVQDASLLAEVLDVGRDRGLDLVGVAPADPFLSTRADLEERRARGLHAGMQFTYRNPRRSTDPRVTVPGARALVVGARSYAQADPPKPPGPQGRVARYARADEYGALRGALGAVADHLRTAGWTAVVLVDDNALVDREAAYRAGLGWYGKNANLLAPGRGSWFVLGSVVTDAPLPVETAPVGDGCGSCRRCIAACPTGAIVAPGVVDATRCLAWLVQQAGMFPREHRAALGDRIYGCDACQEVCPPNIRFAAEAGPGARAAWVSLLEILGASDEEILDRHGRWYIPRRDPRWVRRNALVALGNTGSRGDPAVVAALRRALADADPVLRAHAVWASARLGLHDLVEGARSDTAPEVLAEIEALEAR